MLINSQIKNPCVIFRTGLVLASQKYKRLGLSCEARPPQFRGWGAAPMHIMGTILKGPAPIRKAPRTAQSAQLQSSQLRSAFKALKTVHRRAKPASPVEPALKTLLNRISSNSFSRNTAYLRGFQEMSAPGNFYKNPSQANLRRRISPGP